MVVAIETGGRWSEEAVQFVWQLAQAKAQEAPRFLTQQVALAWERRWTHMLHSVRRVLRRVIGGTDVA